MGELIAELIFGAISDVLIARVRRRRRRRRARRGVYVVQLGQQRIDPWGRRSWRRGRVTVEPGRLFGVRGDLDGLVITVRHLDAERRRALTLDDQPRDNTWGEWDLVDDVDLDQPETVLAVPREDMDTVLRLLGGSGQQTVISAR